MMEKMFKKEYSDIHEYSGAQGRRNHTPRRIVAYPRVFVAGAYHRTVVRELDDGTYDMFMSVRHRRDTLMDRWGTRPISKEEFEERWAKAKD